MQLFPAILKLRTAKRGHGGSNVSGLDALGRGDLFAKMNVLAKFHGRNAVGPRLVVPTGCDKHVG